MNSPQHKPKSLVTGGAGFIGSHVARHCLDLNHDVVVLDDLSGGFAEQVPGGAAFVRGSVTDDRLVSELFAAHRFDYVYHLAAYAAEGLSHFIRRYNYTNNLIGTVNLINEAIKAQTKCFVFTSSIAVYGKGQLPMSEDMVPRPEDPYGISKYAAELDLAAASELFGLPFVVFRPHNVYGEGQNFADPYRNVLGIFMSQILRGEPLTIFGDGEQTRAFTHIDDVAPHISRSVCNPRAWNQVFNIGADQPYTVNELARVTADAFGVELKVSYLPARKEVVHAYSTHAKADQILSANPTVGLEEGIRRMAQWVRSVGIRPSKPFSDIEVNVNMPPSWAAFSGAAVPAGRE